VFIACNDRCCFLHHYIACRLVVIVIDVVSRLVDCMATVVIVSL
jgi:hypothetical protein